ncbi:MAG: PilZ domain-containing protein [bacterium]|nr:PilZ domain-containing protein [bacterium]
MKIDKERRRHQRYRYEALVSHEVSTNDVTHTGKMFNFCKGGLYFESDQNIYPGQDIFVGLAIHADSPGKDVQLIFEVKIIWYKQLGDSPFRYGFGGKFLNSYDSFDSFPETGQIKKLAEQEALQGDFSGDNDSRKQNRRPYNKFLRFSYRNNDYKQVVTNIGRGGAFISTKEKFALGGKLTLTVPGSQSRKEVKVAGWIVRTSPDGIGVSFERRAGRERRNDLDRRTGSERRSRKRGKTKP